MHQEQTLSPEKQFSQRYKNGNDDDESDNDDDESDNDDDDYEDSNSN